MSVTFVGGSLSYERRRAAKYPKAMSNGPKRARSKSIPRQENGRDPARTSGARLRLESSVSSRGETGGSSLYLQSQTNYLGRGLGERLTTTTVEVLPAKVPLPMYTACTLCTPTLSWLFQLACVPVKASTGPSCWFPSSSTTNSPSLLPGTLITKFALCSTPFAKTGLRFVELMPFTVNPVEL